MQKKLSQQALEQAEVENSELSFGDTQIQVKLNKAGDFEEIFFEVPVSITVENEKMEMSYATHMYYTGFDDQVTLNFPDDFADYQSADLRSRVRITPKGTKQVRTFYLTLYIKTTSKLP